MKRRKLLWQLMLTYHLMTLAALLAITWYALGEVRGFYSNMVKSDLEVRAHLLEKAVVPHLNPIDTDKINQLCKEYGNIGGTRFTVIVPGGKVVGDSHENPTVMDNHGDRPEIKKAYTGIIGDSSRYSHTLQTQMKYVAIPLKANDQVVGVLRTSMPLTDLADTQRSILSKIILGGFLIALLATLISYVASRRISRPLEQMTRAAQQFASGDLGIKVPMPASKELAQLATAMNTMAVELDEKISTIERRRNEEEAMLSSMIEGIIAVDHDQNVINMNDAAAKLTGSDPVSARSRSVQEVIRNPDLHQFIAQMLESSEAIESDIVIYAEETRYLQAHGTRLRDPDGKVIGGLVVLHDLTRLRRLENIRRDFVANVSHELKTPITTISGFVETLLDGAMKEPENAERFLQIIGSQADRLTSIVEDLLSLSRLEQENEKGRVALSEYHVRDVLESAVEACKPKAESKKIRIDLKCDPELLTQLNPPLAEQAIINLVDNAVKYSNEETQVTVQAEVIDNNVLIHVIDQGAGIAKEHLPRLFERFYRIDKARSRKMGGTGLGLSIVKHIAQAHNGQVQVDSKIGEGSTFTFVFPQRPENT